MNKKEVFKHYSEILDNLIDNSDFFKIYFQECYTLEEDMEITDSLSLCTGLSRGCLVDKNYDYVVKFDIDVNYCGTCNNEINIYENAKYNHVEKFFTQPMYLGTYIKSFDSYVLKDVIETIDSWYSEDDFYSKFSAVEENCDKQNVTIALKLFAYPRANTQSISSFTSYTIEDEEYAENSTSPLREYNLAIAAAFIADYGTEEYNQLTEFLYDWNINDIHLDNIGELNNHICIIDYAGV